MENGSPNRSRLRENLISVAVTHVNNRSDRRANWIKARCCGSASYLPTSIFPTFIFSGVIRGNLIIRGNVEQTIYTRMDIPSPREYYKNSFFQIFITREKCHVSPFYPFVRINCVTSVTYEYFSTIALIRLQNVITICIQRS